MKNDMAILSEQSTLSTLLNFDEKLDINLLDNVVTAMYNGHDEQRKVAQNVLTNLKEHPNAWTRVDTILEFSNNQQTKYFALQILEQVIKTRWKALPRNQCEGIKKYIVGLIIKTSSDSETLEREKVYLNKLNIILVQILKREWPKHWESFISDIIGASKTNESLCQNNMTILKLLSEEVFDFSSGQLTQTKAKHLRDTICAEFIHVFQLCLYVMENSQNAPLVGATLDTLLRFFNWIPLGYIFETDLMVLLSKFLNVPMFRNVTLKCLTEIAGVEASAQYDDKFILLFTETMTALEQMLPLTTDIRAAYSSGQDAEQEFIQNLTLFLCTFLKAHGEMVEDRGLGPIVLNATHYLVLISEVDEVEIFKICLEYWNSLASNLYQQCSQHPSYPVYGYQNHMLGMTPRRSFYASALTKMRYIMISRMARPEEVLVVENENGEVVREFMKDTDAINLYKNMRETLVFLTHLDYADTERIMTSKLTDQVTGVDWSWKNLNTLCWAIGSISGALQEEDERRFLVVVIKDLLGLCEQKKGKDNKAIIASNIMYIVGQYPRFLRAHWKFLKTVVNKLFEFMHETHDGVQDMACDTFIKISQKCWRHFVTIQAGEAVPFIDELLGSISTIICDLQPQQVHTFYEAVGIMISAQSDQTIQEVLIEKYMMLPNQVWTDIISRASKNVEIFKDHDTLKQLISILKTNVKACQSLGHRYAIQLGKIFLDMLNIYKIMSDNINEAIRLNSETVMKQPVIKSMRIVKKEILKLISKWMSLSNDPNLVLTSFIPPILEAVLLDYRNTPVASAREPEVLSMMTAIVNKLQGHITSEISKIFDAVFECTLDMINKDFENFPEHRLNFYLFLEAVNMHCFSSFLSIPPEQFKLVLDAIIWAFKHAMRNVADIGLNIILQLLKNVALDESVAQSFYKTYFIDILEHVFSVVTDTSHAGGLLLLSTLLAYMFFILENKMIKVPLDPKLDISTPVANFDNVTFVKQYVAQLLRVAFPHLTDHQIKVTVDGMLNLNHDVAAFNEHLRDFLVQIREFTGEDDSDLFLEEREAQLKKIQEEKKHFQMNIPGVLNPFDDLIVAQETDAPGKESSSMN